MPDVLELAHAASAGAQGRGQTWLCDGEKEEARKGSKSLLPSTILACKES